MKATADLKKEHEIICSVAEAVARKGEEFINTGQFDDRFLEKALEFFTVFVDRCHHGKEENHLFARINEYDIAEAKPKVVELIREHETGRNLIREISEIRKNNDEPSAKARQLGETLRRYYGFIKEHIEKEDNGLFPLADAYLSVKDQEDVKDAFDRFEEEEMGKGTHERIHAIAEEILNDIKSGR